MKSKEKADKIFAQFLEAANGSMNIAKQSSLILCEEIIRHAHFITANQEAYTFWLEVKVWIEEK